MDGMYFKHFSTAVEGSSRLLCSHICGLDSWMLRENYSLICGEADWTAASPCTIPGPAIAPDQRLITAFFTATGLELIHGWSQFVVLTETFKSVSLDGFDVSYQIFLEWSQAEYTEFASRYQSSLSYSRITWWINLSSHIFFHLFQHFNLILNNWCNTDLLLGKKKNKIHVSTKRLPSKKKICVKFQLNYSRFHDSTLLWTDLQTMWAHVRLLDAFLRFGQTKWLIEREE